jgi:ketosteroid isomerase-like protein
MMRLREEGDFAQLAAFLTEDCELMVPGHPGMNPFISSARGRDSCLTALRANFTWIELVGLVPLHFVCDGDWLVVTWTSGMRNRGTGPTIEVKGLCRLRFRGTRVSFYANYLDTAAVAALAGMPARLL